MKGQNRLFSLFPLTILFLFLWRVVFIFLFFVQTPNILSTNKQFGNVTNYYFATLAFTHVKYRDPVRRQKSSKILEKTLVDTCILKKYVGLCFRWNITKNLPLSQKQ